MALIGNMAREVFVAKDPRKRQKKLERRSAKRKEKRHLLHREENVGLAERLRRVSNCPVLHCSISEKLEDSGLGWVMLSRTLPGGSIAIASFVVDRYCLGVKDAFGEIMPHSAYEQKYLRKMMVQMPSRSVSPAEARKLIEGAISYARSIGFSPHADYGKVVPLFGDVNAADSDAHFEFGKDGKPFFVAGPYESEERCNQVLAILDKTCGSGQYHYLIGVGNSKPILLDDDHELDFDDFSDEE
jgi:hypothetical protein